MSVKVRPGAPGAIPERRPKSPRVQKLGPVSIHEIYPLEVFKQLTGLAGAALRTARRAPCGLRVLKVGRRRFIRGSDFAAYLDSLSVTPEDS